MTGELFIKNTIYYVLYLIIYDILMINYYMIMNCSSFTCRTQNSKSLWNPILTLAKSRKKKTVDILMTCMRAN